MSGVRRNGFLGFEMVLMILIVQGDHQHLVSSTTAGQEQSTTPSTMTELNRSLTGYACEDTELTITCSDNENIHIVYANYGRRSLNICNPDNITGWRIDCIISNSTLIVQNLCFGKSNCTVRVHNDLFNDPCHGTPKYLAVVHRCVEGNTTISTSDMDHNNTTPMSSEPSSTPAAALLQCKQELKRNVNWIGTVNQVAKLPCPNNNNSKMALRTCVSQDTWKNDIDLSECISQQMLELQRKLESLRTNFSFPLVHELMEGLANVSQLDNLYGGDLVLLAKVIVDAIDLTESKSSGNVTNEDADRINELVLSATSNLLLPGKNDTWGDLPPVNQSSTATRLLSSVESSSALLANSNDTLNVTRNLPGLDVLVDVRDLSRLSNQSVVFPKPFSVDLSSGDIVDEKGLGRVTVALIDGVGQWLHLNDSTTTTTTAADLNGSSSEATPNVAVNTRVMSISIVSRSEGGLKERVQYTLEHREKNSSDPVCVFWKYSKATFEGHWSGDGCRNVSSNATHTVCECDHLTNFAVLMSVSSVQLSAGDAFALSVITYVGCMISIVCLALAFITFYWFRGLQCDRNTIHKNLVLCLFISEVIFLLGIVQYEHQALCAAVTGFLHYFFLASFSWMCLEGVQLYVLLIEVFEAEKSRLRWYYISAYGVPALIVVISAIVTGAQGHPYAAKEYCWLAKDFGLIWAFVGPALVIIVVNSVMLGVAIHTMCKHTSTATSWKLKQKTKIETIGSWIRGAVVLMILLGSTWTFGILYVNEHSLFMAYIFTILNSLQGLFIFIFHCLTNEKVQKEYRRCIQRHTWLPENVRVKYGGLSGSAALSTTPNQSNSSGIPVFFRMLKGRKRGNSLSSSSFQKSSSDSNRKDKVKVIISPPGEGSSSSTSAASHKVKRHASNTSESARLTDSSGIPSSDYLYEHDDITEAPSGYMDMVITHVDENEFNGPDMAEISAMEESFIITDRREHSRR